MTELPDGWATAALGEIVMNRDNQRIPINATERAKRLGSVPYYGAAGQVGWIDTALYDEQLLLLGEDGVQFFDPGKPKAYVVNGPSWVNNHAHVLSRVTSGPPLPYLKYFLDQFDYRGFANGTTRLKLTRSAMDTIPVRVAPTAEQERIVSAIEEASSKLAAGEAGLRTVRQLLKRMREAVLAAAVTGRLVPQDPTDTPAKNLLADLGADQAPSDLLPPLPRTWVATTVGAVSLMSLGKMLDAKTQTGRHPQPYLRNINVRWFSFELENLAFMDIRPDEFERVAVADGDLVVCEGGQPGRCAVWRREPMAIQKALHRVRPRSGISGDYLGLMLSWWVSRPEYERFITGTTIKHIPKEKLKLIPVPLPPGEEQRRIVAEVERQLSFVAACERAVDAGLARSAALRRSVLKAAFEGRLVPQDASEEPAAALLERIRVDRASSEKSAGGRRRKKVEAS